VTAVPVAVRFLRRIDATVVQWQERLRSFLPLLGTTISRRTALTFVAAGMRRRIDAILPHGELVVRTVRQLVGNLRPRKMTLTLVVAGLVGLVLILLLLLLLEISLRMELAKEARDAAIDVTSAPSARPQKMEFGDAFPTQPTGSILLQSVEQLPGAQPSPDYGQTFGQVFQEPVPLPRSRKRR
jgi:hypothetical protein